MSKKVHSGKVGTSDESNSTEHDATVSLSGTDEFNDTHSIFSDSMSLASKASKLNDAKKSVHKINKLKEENALLREALEKANASDVTMLKSKLRGSNADLVRLRQNNMELKDRIQVLEGRLFNALSLQSTRGKGVPGGNDEASSGQPLPTLPEFYTNTSQSLDNKFTSSERAHLMDMIKSLQSRCKHLARLVQSYETKMSVLQAEIDKNKAHDNMNGGTLERNKSNHSIEFNVLNEKEEQQNELSVASVSSNTSEPRKSALKTTGVGLTSLVKSEDQPGINHAAAAAQADRKRVKIEALESETRIQGARETDLRMIRELSEEVKRLAALVPRERIEESEEKEIRSSTKSDEGEKDDRDQVDRKLFAPPHTNAVGGRRLPTNDLVNGNNLHQLYGPDHLLCSFFSGVAAMLICVAISGFSLYSSSGSIEDMDTTVGAT